MQSERSHFTITTIQNQRAADFRGSRWDTAVISGVMQTTQANLLAASVVQWLPR